MRKTITLIALLGACISAGFAQVKIGVINSQDILEKSTEGKKVIARLQEANNQNQTQLATLDDQIRKLQTELTTQRITMTEDAIMAKGADLERKNTDRKRKAEDAYASMNDLQTRLFKKIQDELIPLVEQVGKEKGMDIIFDLAKSGAIYWSPAIDMTTEVIKKYDASKAAGK